MKRLSLITALTAIMLMMSSALSFAAGNLELVSSYPEDGQTNTSIENLGVKLTFSNPINSEEARKTDESKFSIKDEDGETVPIHVLFSEKNDGLVLVLADADSGFTAKNNAEYTLTIDAGLVDNEGNVMEQARTVSFRTYNQRVNNMVNMAMMFIMFGGIMVLTMRQNNKKEEEEEKVTETKEAAFNPYKEARKTGKSVEEVRAAQAKKEAKQARKKARKNKDDSQSQDRKIENCAELLNNVYHVHAPAPVNKADRSIEALRAERKSSGTGKSKSSKGKKKK